KMEAVGRLAGGLAHDFNNLLTALLGHCDLLEQRVREGKTEKIHVEEIRAAAERASVLTRQLLAFGRKQAVQPAVLDINEVVTGIQQLVQVLLNKDIRLELQLSKSRLLAKVDRNQLEQVVLNLVLNARDAMPRGGRITVQTGELALTKQQPA